MIDDGRVEHLAKIVYENNAGNDEPSWEDCRPKYQRQVRQRVREVLEAQSISARIVAKLTEDKK